jgi:hypothetical protein
MNTQRDNDRLDDLIFRTINTEKPHFDAEKWEEKYPDEYQSLISRKGQASSFSRPNIWKVILDKPSAQVAAAAAVILVIGLLIGRGWENPDGQAGRPELIAQSPAKIISMASMRTAYQQGGLDALDKQLGDTLDVVGPRSSSVSIRELLEGLNTL